MSDVPSGLAELLAKVRNGTSTQSDADELEKHLLNDGLVPEVRNRLAYQHHIKKHGNAGVHAHVDLNGFGLINKLYSEQVGDQTIQTAGKVLAEVGKRHGARVFRSGGDEFKLWFLRPQDGENFGREIGDELANHHQVPGGFKLSASIGFGWNEGHAQQKMLEAKNHVRFLDSSGKINYTYEPGKAPTAIASGLHEPTPEGWKSAHDSIKGGEGLAKAEDESKYHKLFNSWGDNLDGFELQKAPPGWGKLAEKVKIYKNKDGHKITKIQGEDQVGVDFADGTTATFKNGKLTVHPTLTTDQLAEELKEFDTPAKSKKIGRTASRFWDEYETALQGAHFAYIDRFHKRLPNDQHSEVDFFRGGRVNSKDSTHQPTHEELEAHAKLAQDLVINDPDITKIDINGVPHVRLYRGVSGSYAHKIKQAHDSIGADGQIAIPNASFSSWTTREGVARTFSRRYHPNQPKGGAVMSALFPVSSLIHSGIHDLGFKHAYAGENELVVGHTDPETKINKEDVKFHGHLFNYGLPSIDVSDQMRNKSAMKLRSENGKHQLMLDNNGALHHYEGSVLHNETGPAVIHPNGNEQWYMHGIQFDPKQSWRPQKE